MRTDRIPLGERAQQDILTHIETVGDEAETSYLEIKSTLDLGKKSDLAKIAKFLLGAANRTVKDASRNFAGYAVLVIGASRGGSAGVPRGSEAHDLENALRPYLGPDLPIFDLGRVAVDDEREVLFIFSPPPVDGQPPFPCRKEFRGDKGQEQLDDGAIYVRGRSNTRPARSSEILGLVERARGVGKPPVSLDVRVVGRIRYVHRVAETLELLYAHEKNEYLKVPDETEGGFETIIGRGITRALDERRRQSAVDGWLQEKPGNVSAGIEHLLGASLDPIQLQITSIDRFVAKPHLTIEFHGCRLYDHVDRPSMRSIVKPIAESGPGFFSVPSSVLAGYGVSQVGYPVAWEMIGDVAVVKITPEAFRPNAQWATDDDDFVLVATDSSSTAVSVNWTLTEDASDIVSTGQLSIVLGDPVDASDLFLELFRDYSGEE